jgi:hypothetical protein
MKFDAVVCPTYKRAKGAEPVSKNYPVHPVWQSFNGGDSQDVVYNEVLEEVTAGCWFGYCTRRW